MHLNKCILRSQLGALLGAPRQRLELETLMPVLKTGLCQTGFFPLFATAIHCEGDNTMSIDMASGKVH